MNQIFDFSGREKSENALLSTWNEFRDCLKNGDFQYDEIEKAKQVTFLNQYNDLFLNNLGILPLSVSLSSLQGDAFIRGAILDWNETPDYDRFIPKAKFIKKGNRFSPRDVEWLYMAMSEDEPKAIECARKECRAERNDRFAYCHFMSSNELNDIEIVDLTIEDDKSFDDINMELEKSAQKIESDIFTDLKNIKKLNTSDSVEKTINARLDIANRERKIIEPTVKWAIYTYSKMLSEQIFVPLDVEDKDRDIEYAPFQTLAQYYISLGYGGIVYKSSVCQDAKNIVLFDKNLCKPAGSIEIEII